MKYIKIKTKIGYLIRRDTIYLDIVLHNENEGKLTFEGQINGNTTSIPQSKKWIDYKLEFTQIYSYKCIPLDDFNENLTESRFDMVKKDENSDFINYVVLTYDSAFEIIAKGHEFSFN